MSRAGTQRLTREAAEWFVRVHDEAVTTEEFNDWQRWLAHSAPHRQAFQTVEDFWQDAGQIADPPWPSIRELNDDSDDGTRPVAPKWMALAAGMLLLLVAATIVMPR